MIIWRPATEVGRIGHDDRRLEEVAASHCYQSTLWAIDSVCRLRRVTHSHTVRRGRVPTRQSAGPKALLPRPKVSTDCARGRAVVPPAQAAALLRQPGAVDLRGDAFAQVAARTTLVRRPPRGRSGTSATVRSGGRQPRRTLRCARRCSAPPCCASADFGRRRRAVRRFHFLLTLAQVPREHGAWATLSHTPMGGLRVRGPPSTGTASCCCGGLGRGRECRQNLAECRRRVGSDDVVGVEATVPSCAGIDKSAETVNAALMRSRPAPVDAARADSTIAGMPNSALERSSAGVCCACHRASVAPSCADHAGDAQTTCRPPCTAARRCGATWCGCRAPTAALAQRRLLSSVR